MGFSIGFFMPFAASRDGSLGSAYAEQWGDFCSSPANLTFLVHFSAKSSVVSDFFFLLLFPFRQFFPLYRYFQELSVWFIFYFQYSMKLKNNISLWWPWKITEVRQGGLQIIQPSTNQLHRSACPPKREQSDDSSRAGKCRWAAFTECAKKSPAQTHSSFGRIHVMAITAPGRK